MSLSPGTQFGPYEIRSALGAGGMGEVYLARDSKLQRDVALKILPREVATDPDRIRRFETEARSASALNHPAIVSIYDLGQQDGQLFISMELVKGQTFRELFASGPLPSRRALHLAAQIADGLAKAHDAGIVHRDLKPDNLMVTDDGFAKILDFGLAKLADESEGTTGRPTVTDHATRPGSVMGTAGYMSPEQASGHAADHRSDQFSLGVVVYEMLTGRLAFDFPTPVERLSAVIREEPPPIAQLAPLVPAPVRWIVERCLAKAPSERYASTRDLARDLATARDRLSELTTGSAAGIQPAPSRRWREWLAWSAAAVFAIAAAALALRVFSTTDDGARVVRFSVAPPDGGTFSSVVGASPFAVSADGQRLAFVADGPGRRRQLWIRSFDSLDAQPVPGTEGARHPFWSPDNRSIAFFADSRLKRVALSGGDVVTICEAGAGAGGTWNQDGTIVFAPSLETPLMRVSASGGTPTAATELDASQGDSGHMAPVFLPDGRRFLFSLFGGGRMGIFTGALDSREIRRVTTFDAVPGFVAPDLLLFVQPDGRLSAQRLEMTRLEPVGDVIPIAERVDTPGPNAAFSASASGTLVYWAGSDAITQPTWFTRDGKVAGTLGAPAAYVDLAISPDGRQVAVDRVDDDPSIWLLDVARGTATRETSGPGKYLSTPIWAPDGRSIAYAKAEGTPPNVFVERLGVGTEGQRLVRSIHQSFPQAWSPDGATIVYVTIVPKTGADVWMVPTRGEPTPAPLLVTPSSENRVRISPDGRWIAYNSNESGVFDVFVTRFPQPGQKWPVSIAGGQLPIWRRDGRELFYLAPDGSLMAAPIVLRDDEVDVGAPVKLFSVTTNVGPGLGTVYDVAPDGRFLVNVAVRVTSPAAAVIMNWPKSLGARAE